jgi:DNA-binding response OmpR family regulator
VSLTVKLEPAQRPAGMASLTKSNPGFAARRPDQEMALVAVEGDMANELISGVVLRAGLKLLAAANGKQALAIIEQQRPAIVIADVGLPAPNGIEICDSIRKSPYGNRIGVILLASLYGQTKYEKNAVAECGADEYLERHRIAADLANLVKVVLERRVQSRRLTPPPPAPAEPVQRAAPFPSGSSTEKRAAVKRTDADDALLKETQRHEAARRLAASIVADLAQFNAKMVEEGIRNGTFYDVLKDDLEEGLRLYRQQVSPEIIAQRDYFQEAVDELIMRKKATLGLG